MASFTKFVLSGLTSELSDEAKGEAKRQKTSVYQLIRIALEQHLKDLRAAREKEELKEYGTLLLRAHFEENRNEFLTGSPGGEPIWIVHYAPLSRPKNTGLCGRIAAQPQLQLEQPQLQTQLLQLTQQLESLADVVETEVTICSSAGSREFNSEKFNSASECSDRHFEPIVSVSFRS
jgi:hypothetical protein